MSRGANLSILGLYNNDNTVLDMMQFPDGFTDTDKQIVKDNILIECAEFECLYPNPYVMKTVIGVWSAKELPYWQRIYNASLLEYNPIENYRRTEEESVEEDKSEEHSGSDIATAAGSDSFTKTGTDSQTANSNSTDTNSGTDTTTNKITGYDSGDLVTHDSTDTTHGHVITNYESGTNSTTYGSTDTTIYGKTDTMQHGEKIANDNNLTRNLLAYGNIGVTTSQEMLTQELELAKIIEVIPVIIESFKNRFCLLVY